MTSIVRYEEREFLGSAALSQDLGQLEFMRCRCRDCTLAQTSWAGTILRETLFERCHLVGGDFALARFNEVRFVQTHLQECHLAAAQRMAYEMEFQDCVLQRVDFSWLRVRGLRFINCRLEHCDFSHADLRNVRFRDCDLVGSRFQHTDLTGADFTSATNYAHWVASGQNRLDRAQFSMPEAALIAARLKVFPISK